MQCIYLNADGTLTATTETLEQCSGYVLVPSHDAAAYVESIQITALEIGESFTWGFGLVVLFGFLSFKVKAARMVINKL
ncbi:hypothetical protein NH514_09640 [Pseudoalteromonas sp. ACER1]|jgi:hypothetical protein|uniref:hypothetical protein n=1 Tax=unclassified Pseudoalteromonas TaxID=194690 RepID=UPI000CF64ED3|nr:MULTISPECIES: hypothetical protein [unclassified Pseudoalteromonas]MCF2850117.1 hypothetical protein [Pseudoalteromonas sp. PAST1]MCO7210996.1 hypothetical protein [Pseudoalteromonas sp. ACER1]